MASSSSSIDDSSKILYMKSPEAFEFYRPIFNKKDPSRSGGYLIMNSVVCRGITNALKLKFYPNFREFQIRRGQYGSSKKSGISVHKHIFHLVMCEKGKCLCKGRLGSAPRMTRTTTSEIALLMKSFNLFIENLTNWVPFASEVVVATPDCNYATSVDLVCVDNIETPTKVCLIEIKTGYRALKTKARTIDGTGRFIGTFGNLKLAGGKSTLENNQANHHQLQLLYTTLAFEKTYKIPVAQAMIVYLQQVRPFYKIEPAASWWFHSSDKDEVKSKFMEQLKKK
jgi:hypothetical protein